MASLLGGVTRLAVMCGMAVAHGALTASAEPIEQSDVHAFSFDQRAAVQQCDVAWLEAHTLPSATVELRVRGRAPITVSAADYFARLRARCRPDYGFGRRSYDEQRCAVRTSNDRAVVQGELARGSMLDYYLTAEWLGVPTGQIASIAFRTVLVRGRDRVLRMAKEQREATLSTSPSP